MHSKIFKLVSIFIVMALALTSFSIAGALQPSAGTVSGLPSLGPYREILYLSNTDGPNDGLSSIYRVLLDPVGGQANLVLLPNGQVPYDHIDTMAATPDGGRIYMVDDGPSNPKTATMAYYDVLNATVHEIGVVTANGTNLSGIDQAAFSPDNTLYITSRRTSKLYTLNVETAVATEVGNIVDQATGQVVVLAGADIDVTSLGEFFLYTNGAKDGSQRGLYKLDLAGAPGIVNATHISSMEGADRVPGMAVRANGYGELALSTQNDDLHIVSKADGNNVINPLLLYLDGAPFDQVGGDMTVGMMQLCNSPKTWWETNPWGGLRVTVLGVPVDETFGHEIMTKAHWANFSKMVAQLVTAKLNVNNATGLAVIDDAEAWLATQGLVKADGSLDWNKPFESRQQQDAAYRYFVSLRQFNESSPCQNP
jgi:hypothetical protein